MIDFSHDPAVTASMRQWRGREAFPTDFGSADLRGLSSELHLRSIFSARTTNADYLNEVAADLEPTRCSARKKRWNRANRQG